MGSRVPGIFMFERSLNDNFNPIIKANLNRNPNLTPDLNPNLNPDINHNFNPNITHNFNPNPNPEGRPLYLGSAEAVLRQMELEDQKEAKITAVHFKEPSQSTN
jgi:hypothetical protein